MARRKKEVIVREYLERVSGQVLELDDYRRRVAQFIKGHAGVYALYKDDRLYYVGLASNMMARVKHHLKDRHKKRWNRFSVYLTTQGDHVRPLEALVLRIVNPEGNKVKGKLRGAKDLFPGLRKSLRDEDDNRRARLLGERALRGRRRRKTRSARGSLPLAGLINRGVTLRAVYKGKHYRAVLRRDGYIRYNGVLYESPSAAAKVVIKRGGHGWTFWKYRKARNQWVALRNLKR